MPDAARMVVEKGVHHRYCANCAGWIMGGYHAHKYAKGIEVEVIDE